MRLRFCKGADALPIVCVAGFCHKCGAALVHGKIPGRGGGMCGRAGGLIISAGDRNVGCAGANFCSGCGTPVPAAAVSPAVSPAPAAPQMLPPRASPDAAPAPAKAGPKGGWNKLKKEIHNVVPERPADAADKSAAPKHVAVLKDDSLRELLIEAFKIAEIRFQNFDNDRAGMLMFDEVKHDIGQAGFYDEGRLLEIWRRCDIDRSNTIDFAEFLFLLHMWQYASDIASNLSVAASPSSPHSPQVR
jgi:hypothetical protein